MRIVAPNSEAVVQLIYESTREKKKRKLEEMRNNPKYLSINWYDGIAQLKKAMEKQQEKTPHEYAKWLLEECNGLDHELDTDAYCMYTNYRKLKLLEEVNPQDVFAAHNDSMLIFVSKSDSDTPSRFEEFDEITIVYAEEESLEWREGEIMFNTPRERIWKEIISELPGN